MKLFLLRVKKYKEIGIKMIYNLTFTEQAHILNGPYMPRHRLSVLHPLSSVILTATL